MIAEAVSIALQIAEYAVQQETRVVNAEYHAEAARQVAHQVQQQSEDEEQQLRQQADAYASEENECFEA